jgi:hypothetical protein
MLIGELKDVKWSGSFAIEQFTSAKLGHSDEWK